MTKSLITTLKNKHLEGFLFHVYYWGRFELVEEYERNGHHFFAKASSNAINKNLSYQERNIYLHEEGEQPRLITDNLDSFFTTSKQNGRQLIFDSRASYEDLFFAEQMYISPFRDPEDFEEVNAYVNLVTGMEKHFGNVFGIKKINAEESGHLKIIYMQLSEMEWEIKLEKELFDTKLLHSLNRLLSRLGNSEETLHLSINPEMYMVILKLNESQLEKSARMGLIV